MKLENGTMEIPDFGEIKSGNDLLKSPKFKEYIEKYVIPFSEISHRDGHLLENSDEPILHSPVRDEFIISLAVIYLSNPSASVFKAIETLVRFNLQNMALNGDSHFTSMDVDDIHELVFENGRKNLPKEVFSIFYRETPTVNLHKITDFIMRSVAHEVMLHADFSKTKWHSFPKV